MCSASMLDKICILNSYQTSKPRCSLQGKVWPRLRNQRNLPLLSVRVLSLTYVAAGRTEVSIGGRLRSRTFVGWRPSSSAASPVSSAPVHCNTRGIGQPVQNTQRDNTKRRIAENGSGIKTGRNHNEKLNYFSVNHLTTLSSIPPCTHSSIHLSLNAFIHSLCLSISFTF